MPDPVPDPEPDPELDLNLDPDPHFFEKQKKRTGKIDNLELIFNGNRKRKNNKVF